LAQAIALVLLLCSWQIAANIRLNAYYLSTPLQVTEQLGAWCASGYLWPHLLATVENTLIGFAIAAVVGIPMALAMAGSPRLAKVVEPLDRRANLHATRLQQPGLASVMRRFSISTPQQPG
jgi:NitT/TauT family transport system permease protein